MPASKAPFRGSGIPLTFDGASGVFDCGKNAALEMLTGLRKSGAVRASHLAVTDRKGKRSSMDFQERSRPRSFPMNQAERTDSGSLGRIPVLCSVFCFHLTTSS